MMPLGNDAMIMGLYNTATYLTTKEALVLQADVDKFLRLMTTQTADVLQQA